MRKQTKHPTRRKLTLRRWVLVLALLAAGYFLLPAPFFPTQTLRFQERENAIGRTTIIQRETAGPVLFFLSKNDHVLFLTGHRYYFPYGWMDFGEFPLDLTQEDGPVAALSVRCIDQEKSWNHLMLFGVVREDEAVSVRVKDAQIWPLEGTSFQPGDQVWTGEILTDRDGLRYFWFGQDLEPSLTALRFDTLEVLDKTGRVLCTYDLSEQYNSVSG